MSEYVFRIVLATDTAISDDAFEAFSDAVEKFYETATVARHDSGQGFVITDDWDGVTDTDKTIQELAGLAYDAAGGLTFLPVDLRFCSMEIYEAEALKPDIPELASAGDAARILGVSRQRIHQLASDNALFPLPVARVASGPLWTCSAIRWFDSVWERKSGRPSKRIETESTFRSMIHAATRIKAVEKATGTIKAVQKRAVSSRARQQ